MKSRSVVGRPTGHCQFVDEPNGKELGRVSLCPIVRAEHVMIFG